MALMLGTKEAISEAFLAAPDAVTRRQLAYILGRAGWPLDLDDGPLAAAVGDEAEPLKEIVANTKQSELYLALARDLDVMAPKARAPRSLAGSCPLGPASPSAAADAPAFRTHGG